MASTLKITFAKPSIPDAGVVVLLTDNTLAFTGTAAMFVERIGGISRATKVDRFTGKSSSVLDLLRLEDAGPDRVMVVGIGAAEEPVDWVKIGGYIFGKLPASAPNVTILLDLPSGPASADISADIALGARLRAYSFTKYKGRKKDDDEVVARKVTFAVADDAAARKAWKLREAAADGVDLARELVNEPPNILNPAEFAQRATELSSLGVEVEILDEARLTKIGMRALLAVGQGSSNRSRVAVMHWKGAKSPKVKPVVFVGKGVTFDTGGISIKPAANMEDMKGDMAGAACVVGLMHTLAARKAKVNAIGIIGLVENMPDGNAQRPGDIVTSLSGQTIEIINTDAEGRLVLADVLWYAQDRFEPALMVNLATLTGAVLVALGQEHAGMFSNNDELAGKLTAAGLATGDKVWRMPLSPGYDKMIDSKFADMKNTGGRHAGSITAAQFLQRFVNGVPWAHLDIAGTGMSAPQTDTNRSWGSGWGVRLLDRFVADYAEE
ncbi:putative cytosol aminopeptidase [Agaricicola taiwanensis]|uniref:Probable cytosol aminopeptidase n=1 Tax=Agaricicola taiwanensis TaxID=591372 RepID=A0A8J2YJG1_9RHOB|nr:leucyl aminopeptidase [Agaricicola taiwanensis]GGE46823.1 putative cytosol aminopeptidase [Agaricicola taiwanensis]